MYFVSLLQCTISQNVSKLFSKLKLVTDNLRATGKHGNAGTETGTGTGTGTGRDAQNGSQYF